MVVEWASYVRNKRVQQPDFGEGQFDAVSITYVGTSAHSFAVYAQLLHCCIRLGSLDTVARKVSTKMSVRDARSQDPLRVVMFSTMSYEVKTFEDVMRDIPDAESTLSLMFVSARLDRTTASMVSGARAVCLFTNDLPDDHILEIFSRAGVELIALRYPGESMIDVGRAALKGIKVTRSPSHSPTSIAEYAVSLMLALNRKVHIANQRVLTGSFNLEGLVGFNVADKTVGIVGTGQVGRIVARIMRGFNCRVLAYDMIESEEVEKCGGKYVSMKKLLINSDIISLHAPLVPGTHHMIGSETLQLCKRGVHIINTARGGLIDIRAVAEALQFGQVGGLAMDAYEGENGLFYREQGGNITDWNFQLLKCMPNVIITGHQAALTTNALAAMATWTIKTLLQFHRGENLEFLVEPKGNIVKDDQGSQGSAN